MPVGSFPAWRCSRSPHSHPHCSDPQDCHWPCAASAFPSYFVACYRAAPSHPASLCGSCGSWCCCHFACPCCPSSTCSAATPCSGGRVRRWTTTGCVRGGGRPLWKRRSWKRATQGIALAHCSATCSIRPDRSARSCPGRRASCRRRNRAWSSARRGRGSVVQGRGVLRYGARAGQ